MYKVFSQQIKLHIQKINLFKIIIKFIKKARIDFCVFKLKKMENNLFLNDKMLFFISISSRIDINGN